LFVCCCGSGGGEKKLAAMPSREPNYYLAAEEQQEEEEEEEEEEENSERDSDEEDGDGRPSPVGSASHWPQSYKYYPHLPYPIPSDILPSSQAMHSFIPSCLNSSLNSVLDSWVAADSTEEPKKTRICFVPPPLQDPSSLQDDFFSEKILSPWLMGARRKCLIWKKSKV
jgi:hypothetical protein